MAENKNNNQETNSQNIPAETNPQTESVVPKEAIVPNSAFRPAIVAALIVIILIIAGVVFMISNNLTATKNSQPKAVETEQGVNIDFEKLEIADEDNERQRGLMYRQELCDSCAMLFVFPQEQIANFWMKDTEVALDIIFLDQNGKIVQVHKNAEPRNIEKRYPSEDPAKYVLEVKAGAADKLALEKGKMVNIDHLLSQGVEYVWINLEE